MEGVGITGDVQPRTSCAIIACDNGYGHIRRCLLLANRLAESGWNVHLLAPETAVWKLSSIFGLRGGVSVADFHAGTTADNLRRGIGETWVNRLPAMDGFDLIVSDNLPEILEIRPDAVLCGSFLWHRAIEKVDAGLYQHVEQLIGANRPKMIASSLFASTDLYELTQLYPVGLCVAERAPCPLDRGSDLLISCGMSGELEHEFRDLVDSLPSGRPPQFDTVWTEPRLMPENAPDWMKPAEYDSGMYRRLKAALCRPGVGTLTDCLWGGGRAFCCYEAGKKEMVHNAGAVSRAGVGEAYSSVSEAYHAACAYSGDRRAIRSHFAALREISFEGISETAAILENSVGEGKLRTEKDGA